MTASPLTMQRTLQRLGLYLGRLDGIPGPLTCDALVRFLAGPHAPQPIGRPLADALPAAWWAIPNRVNMLLAQVNTECGFRAIAENLNYSAERLCEEFPHKFSRDATPYDADDYAHQPEKLANLVYGGRFGNCVPGDGYRFRGRGWPQISFRSNYKAFSDAAGLNLELLPDAMLQLDVSARVTIAFMERTPGLLAAADAGNVAQVRHLWNGGANGLQSASDSFDKLTILWGNP